MLTIHINIPTVHHIPLVEHNSFFFSYEFIVSIDFDFICLLLINKTIDIVCLSKIVDQILFIICFFRSVNTIASDIYTYIDKNEIYS
jgi:hypothetical protein